MTSKHPTSELIPPPRSAKRRLFSSPTFPNKRLQTKPEDPDLGLCSSSNKRSSLSLNHTPDQAPDKESSSKSPLTICFGVLCLEARSTFFQQTKENSVEVEAKPFGETLALHCKDSKCYLGFCKAPGLCKAMVNCSVRLEARLIFGKQGQYDEDDVKSSSVSPQTRADCYLRVLVYGLKEQGDVLAYALADGGLFLQHPSDFEVATGIEYDNPQYFRLPGSRMPDLGAFSMSKMSEALDEGEKNEVWRIFNTEADAFASSTDLAQSPRLTTILKEHQLMALNFMVEKEQGALRNPKFPPLWEATGEENNERSTYRHIITGAQQSSPIYMNGGILADEMGLGKSLTLLAVICNSLDTQKESKLSLTTLIVTPKSTIPGWQCQIERGLLRCVLFHGDSRQDVSSLQDADIVITTYETLRSDNKSKRSLFRHQWYRVVLDEAHHIRNPSSQTFKFVCDLRSRHRWCLSGTPIQNSIDDFGALLAFIGVPGFVGKTNFQSWISMPLKQNKISGLARLRKLIRATCIRRTKAHVSISCPLPTRNENVIAVKLSTEDQELHKFFKFAISNIAWHQTPSFGRNARACPDYEGNVLSLIGILRRICDHGEQLLHGLARRAWEQRDSRLMNWEALQRAREAFDNSSKVNDSIEETGLDIDTSSELRSLNDAANARRYSTCSQISRSSSRSPLPPQGMHFQKGFKLSSGSTRMSAKLESLISRLSNEQEDTEPGKRQTPTKSVVFSCWNDMLDLIQKTLSSHGFICQRIDGATTLMNRAKAIKQFNDDPLCTVMLANLGSAGEGVDLTVANHVHIVEPQWNPMVEMQAINRVHRIGQTRNVFVRRYIVEDSIEKYVQWVQEDKLRLVKSSFDQPEASYDHLQSRRLEKLQEILSGRGEA